MTRRKNYFFIIITSLLIGCSKGPNNGIPAYIQIDSVGLNVVNGQGSNGHYINSLWLETEGINLGVFEFPSKIPVLASGSKQVIINAGVFKDGDYFNREIYPAFEPYRTTVNFVPEATVVINPTFKYYDNVLFPVAEDFESSNIFAGSLTTNINDTNNIDGKALHIHLDANTTTFNSVFSTPIVIPRLRKVYLEFDFKGTNYFELGLQGITNGSVVQSGEFDSFLPLESGDWYKIYYDVTNIVNSLNADSYNFFIGVIKFTDKAETDVYIDNFKVVVI